MATTAGRRGGGKRQDPDAARGYRAGGGHRPQSWSRLLAAAAWENGEPWFYSKRREVERYFGQLSAFGGGLARLPAWLRTLERVHRWVAAKITIYHARLIHRGLAT